MILKGNQRGHGDELAHHLMKAENEIVEIRELRGFSSHDLEGAFNEIYAVSRGTKCDEYLYSLSLNPPPHADVSDKAFMLAIEEAEKRLGLSGQPRAVVFHTKEGRRHCHVVWSRIDVRTMTARNIAHDRRKLMTLARELFREHGWEMPKGLEKYGQRDPRNYTHAEYQQARRVGKNAGQMKEEIQAGWAQSDCPASLEAALAEAGYILARGDKRSYVVIDEHGEIYSLPKMLGLKTKLVRARLGDTDHLPSVQQVLGSLQNNRPKRQPEAPRKEFDEKDAHTHIVTHHAAFTKAMMERALRRNIPDAAKRKEIMQSVLAHPDIHIIGERDGEAVFASVETIAMEKRMADTAKTLQEKHTHSPDPHAVQRAIFAMNNKLAKETNGAASLSREQIAAIEYMTEGRGLSMLVGVAGAGKTTIMEAAKNALEIQGFRVRGAAPSGIAAASLKNIGMNASTLHALEMRLATADDILANNQGRPLTTKQQAFVKDNLLTDRDIIIVDEAGMVGSKMMDRLLQRVKDSGTKLVLVGDPEQLQSIEAGTAFRDLLKESPHARLSEVRRQTNDWQRQASVMFSDNRTAEALRLYDKHGHITRTKKHSTAIDELVNDYMKAHKQNPQASRLVLAYRRADVADLNEAIRAEMQKCGHISKDETGITTRINDGDEHIESEQNFAIGDRILFRENNTELGVMNGSFGALESVTEHSLSVMLDNGKTVTFSPQEYSAIQHGYAATVHKSQGTTVNECYVLASPFFDKHTTYVAMSRHKRHVQMYAAKNDFRKKDLFTALSRDSDRLSTLEFSRQPERELSLQPEKPAWMNKLRHLFTRAKNLPQQPMPRPDVSQPKRPPVPELSRKSRLTLQQHPTAQAIKPSPGQPIRCPERIKDPALKKLSRPDKSQQKNQVHQSNPLPQNKPQSEPAAAPQTNLEAHRKAVMEQVVPQNKPTNEHHRNCPRPNGPSFEM